MSATRGKRRAPGHRRLRLRKPTWRGWFAIGLGVVLVTIVTLWAIDYGTLGDRIARNVTVEDVQLGRLSGGPLDAALAQANAEYGKGTVEFIINGRVHPMSAAEIGLHLDTATTEASAYDLARDDPALLRPVFWVASWFQPRRAPITVTLDSAKLTEALATLPGQTPVVEPQVVGSVEAIGTTPGAAGFGFDPERVARQIERRARDGTLPLRIPLVADVIEPTVADAEVELLAGQARKLTDRDIDLAIPGASMTAKPPLLRSWITSVVPPGSVHAKLTMDPDAVVHDLRDELGTIITRSIGATFTVEDSEVYLVPQVDGIRCCHADSGSAIFDALKNDEPRLDLPLMNHPPTFTTAKARALGITTRLGTGRPAETQRIWSPPTTPPPTTLPPGDELSPDDRVGTSTTTSTTTTTLPDDPASDGQFIVPIPDRQGQSTNADRAVDLLRGRIIMPGGELSLNAIVGAPSPERDFVPANVATADGPTWVSGGGTDLVAAALFQAAYESGLDIPTSTPHDVLPEGVLPGIEATLGWTEPDLVIANPSEHGVLVWVDRVAGGVRVELFGTPFTRSVETALDELPFGPRNACLSVNVKRTRVFIDDPKKVTDRFEARYTPPPGARDDPARVICPG